MKHSFKEQTTRPLNNLELWRNQSRIKCQAAIFDFDITISEKPQAQATSEVPWLTQKLRTNYGIPFATVTHQHHLTSSLGIKNWPHKTGRVLENLWCQLQFVSKGLRTETTSSTHIQVIISYQSSSTMILRCIKSDLRSHPSQLDIHHVPLSNSATCPTCSNLFPWKLAKYLWDRGLLEVDTLLLIRLLMYATPRKVTMTVSLEIYCYKTVDITVF